MDRDGRGDERNAHCLSICSSALSFTLSVCQCVVYDCSQENTFAPTVVAAADEHELNAHALVIR